MNLVSQPNCAILAPSAFLLVGARTVPLLMVRNHRARRYILRLLPNGAARVTIPRWGNLSEGRRFAERNNRWLDRQLTRQMEQRARPRTWTFGTEVMFRGETARLEDEGKDGSTWVRFGGESVHIANPGGDLRPFVERHLQNLAVRELPMRALELARLHQFPVRKVTIRSQRSRWGSCSVRGSISLNWRLIQAPEFVRDYIILHELAHLRQMNHSPKFWKEVERICPGYLTAEKWLKQHSDLLR